MSNTQREAEGEAGSLQKARCGTRSQDPGITTWAEGRCSTEPSQALSLFFFFSLFICSEPPQTSLCTCESISETCTGELLYHRICTFSILLNTVRLLSIVPLPSSFRESLFLPVFTAPDSLTWNFCSFGRWQGGSSHCFILHFSNC